MLVGSLALKSLQMLRRGRLWGREATMMARLLRHDGRRPRCADETLGHVRDERPFHPWRSVHFRAVVSENNNAYRYQQPFLPAHMPNAIPDFLSHMEKIIHLVSVRREIWMSSLQMSRQRSRIVEK